MEITDSYQKTRIFRGLGVGLAVPMWFFHFCLHSRSLVASAPKLLLSDSPSLSHLSAVVEWEWAPGKHIYQAEGVLPLKKCGGSLILLHPASLDWSEKRTRNELWGEEKWAMMASQPLIEASFPEPSAEDLARFLACFRSAPTREWPGLTRRLEASGTAGLRQAEAHQQLEIFTERSEEVDARGRLRESRLLLEDWAHRGLLFVTILDAAYPNLLREIEDPPPFLFLRGERPWGATTKSVAVVGTRQASVAGRRRTLRLARALAECGVRVVSGLALGIDTAAHQGALAASGRGRTAAVMGTGLDTVYPTENLDLHERILGAGGSIVSPFFPEFQGAKGGANFLHRNRVMAGLCEATVVVEASYRSGARSMVVHAQKLGRKVFLLRSLVEAEEWAQKMLEHENCSVLDQVEDLLQAL